MNIRQSIRSKIPDILRECEVEAMRAQGAGGQHVNRTSSAIRLRWSLNESYSLSLEEKEFLTQKLSRNLTLSGEILIRSESERDQLTNRKECFKKMTQILERALVVQKVRVATKPTRSSQRKRLDGKKIQGEKKQLRAKLK